MRSTINKIMRRLWIVNMMMERSLNGNGPQKRKQILNVKQSKNLGKTSCPTQLDQQLSMLSSQSDAMESRDFCRIGKKWTCWGHSGRIFTQIDGWLGASHLVIIKYKLKKCS